MQTFVRSYRKVDKANKILEVKHYINEHLYDEDLNDDDSFFFNLKFDEKSLPITGDGSDTNHFRVMITSSNKLSGNDSFYSSDISKTPYDVKN